MCLYKFWSGRDSNKARTTHCTNHWLKKQKKNQCLQAINLMIKIILKIDFDLNNKDWFNQNMQWTIWWSKLLKKIIEPRNNYILATHLKNAK